MHQTPVGFKIVMCKKMHQTLVGLRIDEREKNAPDPGGVQMVNEF